MKYAICLGGNSAFLSDAIDEAKKEFLPALEENGWKEDDSPFKRAPSLNVPIKRTASAAATVSLVVGLFLAKKYGEKVFDSVYEQTLKEPTDSFVKKMLSKVRKVRSDAIEYRSLVYLEDMDISILVRLIILTESDTENCIGKINSAHRIAHEYLKSNGKKANIHCHTIINRRCDIEPELFQDISCVPQSYKIKESRTLAIAKG